MAISCGLLMYSPSADGGVSVLLAHPGGPYWRGKDIGAWSIPKGLPDPGEDLLAAAQREFTEETGIVAVGPFLPLTSLKQRSGKLIHCWAFRGSDEPTTAGPSTFELEWPRGSGRMTKFPEVDDVRMFELDEARRKIHPGQIGFLDELHARLRT